MAVAAAGWITAAGGCGSSSSSGGTGGAGGHGGATGVGGHGGGVGGTDGGAFDAHDGGGDASDGGAMFSFTFDSDLNGFDIDPNVTTNPVNLGGVSVDGGALVTLAEDTSVGMPTPGSAHVTTTFSDYNQLVVFRHVYTTPINLTGATLTARVRLDPGADGGVTTFSGVVRMFALSSPNTSAFYLADGGSISLSDNSWHLMTFRLSTAEFVDASFNPAQIVQLGVHIATPPPVVVGDAAPPAFGAEQAISIHIDTVTSN